MFDRDGKSWDPGAKRIFRIRGGSYGVGKSWGLSDDSRIEIKIKISKRSQWKRFWKGDTIGFFRNWFYFRFSEWMRNPEDRTKDPRGMNFVLIITRSLPPVIESRNIIMRYANDTMDTWLLDRNSFGVLGCRNRFSNDCSKICRINYREFANNVLGLWSNELSSACQYIRNWDLVFRSIIVSSIIAYDLNCSFFLFLALAIMSQSQLIGKSGDGKDGEGNRKRLKISIPHFDNSDLVKSYSKTLTGRCMNPAKQDGAALLVMLPKIWKVEERMVGADLGMGRFQFHFDKEEDIVTVLEMQPYHFDYWMIALARWQPKMVRDFPSEIPFWIKIEGVPTEFWSTPTFQSIGDAIGETTDVDLDYGKMRVIIDGRKELCFETTVDFKGGEYYEEEEALVTLKFEKLFGHCSLCLSLCHDLGSCPLNPNPEKKKEGREGAAVRKDDRARSYKGVVINGEGTHQENDKDTRRYQGKGKGKMYEEQESRWERVPERGSKRSFSNRNHNKLEEGGSRNRNARWEQTRRHLEEERSRPSRATRGERTPPRGERSTVSRNREEPREEGEIRFDGSDRGRLQDVEKSLIFPPGPVQETSPLPGDSDQVNLITGELENGLDLVSEFLEDGTNMLDQDKIIADLALSGEGGMELGENHHTRKEIGPGLELDDEFQNLTDGEGKDIDQVDQVEAKEVADDDMAGDIGEGKGATVVEKKPGLRKPLFSVAVGNNSKFAQVLLSPRKRAAAKQSLRKGGGTKQVEEKGSSYPKQLPKP